MTTLMKPAMKPATKPGNPEFSSGPSTKRPGWSPAVLADALTGRSHRSAVAKARLRQAIEETRALLSIPAGHRIAIVPGSDTGAIEMALWSLLGARGIDVLAWESFGKGWVNDVAKQLGLVDARVLEAPYGELPDLARVNFDNDVVFCWNGTTSGVRVPDGAWIAADRAGLTICDATSAAFAMPLPWDKLDVATFSWQKSLGGEAQHGMLVLGPRAAARLTEYSPPWPLPKIFRMTAGDGLNEGLFRGETINTPSMLLLEDYLDALVWARRRGGLKGLFARAERNFAALADWVARTAWVDFLAREPANRSNTSVCLRIVDPAFTALPLDAQADLAKAMVAAIEAEGAAYDIGAYRDAPPGLRIWCGPTVEAGDIAALTPWLDWAYGEAIAAARNAP